MKSTIHSTEEFLIRPFTDADVAACHRMREDAFRTIFAPDIGPAATAAGIRAYSLEKYFQMLAAMHCFIADQHGEAIGFSAVKIIDPQTAELSYLYVRQGLERKGIGARLLAFTEAWLRRQYPAIRSLVLDTIVPAYNGPFYQKMGFHYDGERVLPYPDLPVKTVLMRKEFIADECGGDGL